MVERAISDGESPVARFCGSASAARHAGVMRAERVASESARSTTCVCRTFARITPTRPRQQAQKRELTRQAEAPIMLRARLSGASGLLGTPRPGLQSASRRGRLAGLLRGVEPGSRAGSPHHADRAADEPGCDPEGEVIAAREGRGRGSATVAGGRLRESDSVAARRGRALHRPAPWC